MKKILLVDDKEEVRLLVKTTLEDSEYEFHSASNGKEAIKKTLSIKPDLIFLDIMMPGIDGFEVCRQIKSNAETKKIPIVMLTAKGQKMDMQKGKKCGAEAYFTKPFSPLALLQKTDEFLK